jgi:hypothetical protein
MNSSGNCSATRRKPRRATHSATSLTSASSIAKPPGSAALKRACKAHVWGCGGEERVAIHVSSGHREPTRHRRSYSLARWGLTAAFAARVVPKCTRRDSAPQSRAIMLAPNRPRSPRSPKECDSVLTSTPGSACAPPSR